MPASANKGNAIEATHEGAAEARLSKLGASEEETTLAQRPLALSPWALQRSGRYTLFATNGRQYTLDLNFTAKSFVVTGTGYSQRGNFGTDPEDPQGYIIPPPAGQADLGAARFRMTEDAVVGSFHFPVAFSVPATSALQPFVAVRKLVTGSLSAYLGMYNQAPITRTTLLKSATAGQNVTWQSMTLAAQGVWLDTTASMIVCGAYPTGWNGIPYAADQCPKSIQRTLALRPWPSNANKWEAVDPATGTVQERFYIAAVNGQLVMLNAATDDSAGTASFQIGLPDAMNWPHATSHGADTAGNHVSTSITTAVITSVQRQPSGAQSSVEWALARMPTRSYGLRSLTDPQGTVRGWMARSTRLAVTTVWQLPPAGAPSFDWNLHIGAIDPPRPTADVGPMTLKVRANGVEVVADGTGNYPIRSGDLVELESNGVLGGRPNGMPSGWDWFPGFWTSNRNLRLGGLGLTERSAHTLTFQVSNLSTATAVMDFVLTSSAGSMAVKLNVAPGDPRSGDYAAYAVSGPETQLTLDFDLKRYALLGLPDIVYGQFEEDANHPDAYIFRSSRMHSPVESNMGFRLRDGLVIGNFPISADATYASNRLLPFVASRNFVADAAQLDGVYNVFEAMTDINGNSRPGGKAKQVRISQGGTLMETCQMSFSSTGGCATGQFTEQFAVGFNTASPSVFQFIPLGQTAPQGGTAFRVARAGNQKVFLSSRAATYSSYGLYRIGVQDTTAWREGIVYVGSTHLPCCGTATLTATTYSGGFPPATSPNNYPVSPMPGLAGVRAVNAEGSMRYLAVQNGALALLAGDTANAITASYLQIGAFD